MDRTFAFLEHPSLMSHAPAPVDPSSSSHAPSRQRLSPHPPPPPHSSSSSLRQPHVLPSTSRPDALRTAVAVSQPPPPPLQFASQLPPQPSTSHRMLHAAVSSAPPLPSHFSLSNNTSSANATNAIVTSRQPFQMRSTAQLVPSSIAHSRSFGSAQSAHMLAPNQPSFASMPTLSNAMLSANVVDEPPAAAAPRFVNAQSNEPLNSPAYPWDPTSSSALASNPLSTTNQSHQSIMPLQLVVSTAPTVNHVNATTTTTNPTTNPNTTNPNTTTNRNNNSSNNNNNPNLGIAALGTSFNQNVVRAIVNASSVPSALHPFPTSLGAVKNANAQPLKKPRSNAHPKPPPPRNLSHLPHVKPLINAPLTSPVSTSTIANIKSPLVPGAQPVEPFNAHMKQPVVPLTPAQIASSSNNLTAQGSMSRAKHSAPSAAAWPQKRPRSSRPRSRRKTTNGPAIPVHLRNPKKGRARVFRECKHCHIENHIRRSDCVSCQRPLPPGKRRRDGNPLYDRRRSQAGSSVTDAQGSGGKVLSGGTANSALKGAMSVNK